MKLNFKNAKYPLRNKEWKFEDNKLKLNSTLKHVKLKQMLSLKSFQAKRELSIEDFREQMSSVYTTSVMESTLDEAPEAYKPAEAIIENIKDAVDIVHIVKPVYNFKAHD